jgi:hypothetical protein
MCFLVIAKQGGALLPFFFLFVLISMGNETSKGVEGGGGWGMSVNGPFCSDHFNPFKSIFLLWIWIVTIIRLDVKT